MSEARLRVGMDVASLGDAALTGIPLYIESLLREFLSDPQEDWTLVGGPSAPDPARILTERGVPLPPTCRTVPAVDARFAARAPGLATRPPFSHVVPKLDGRVLMPIGKAATALRVGRVDVFHHTAILRLPPSCARRHIVTIYDLSTRLFPEAHNRVNIAEWERVFAFARDHADLVITDSESARQDVIRMVGVEPSRVRSILLGPRPLPNPDGNRRREIREKWGLGEKRFVLAAGSLDPRKNLPRLIEAFAQIAHEPFLQNTQLVLTGAKLHGAEGVQSAIRKHQLENRVLPTGYASDEELAALMCECDAFAYPSLYEGFGLPVLEALSLGAPVVTSDVSSLPEVAGDAALLVPPTDVNALSSALHRLLTDLPFAAALRVRGPLQAARFSWRDCAAQHRQAYREWQ